MIHYHGLPITPNSSALEAIKVGHAFVSFIYPAQLGLAISVCQSFAIDNGAFTLWKQGKSTNNWVKYYKFALECKRYPSCDFAIIPDVIDGTEKENDLLVKEWPLGNWFGVPVWHMNESFERLEKLSSDFRIVCIGSSGEYKVVGTSKWWSRMTQIMDVICDNDGYPKVKLHGLRMLNPEIFTRIPFSSVDSTNIGRNIGIDSHWTGSYTPPSKDCRSMVMRSRIESHNAPSKWVIENIPKGKKEKRLKLWS